MTDTIDKILEEHYDRNGLFNTHVSMGKKHGKYQLNRQSLEKLWSLYCKRLASDVKTKPMYLAEKPDRSSIPVLVDVDIKIDIGDTDAVCQEDHLYNDEQVSQVIEVYQSVLRNILDECGDEHLTCVLLEKPIYYLTLNGVRYAKNGFHLHFPYVFLSKNDQEEHLLPRVKLMISENNVFSDLGFDDSGVVIDAQCCGNAWLMYGCVKDEGMEPYTVSKVFNAEGSEISLDEAFHNYKIYNEKENAISIEGKVKYYLPRILSILPYNRSTSIIKHSLEYQGVQRVKKDTKKYNTISVEEALLEATDLMPLLGSWRAEERDSWLKIGFILYNISEGSDDGLEMWKSFSAHSVDKYDEHECENQWSMMISKDITIRSLHHLAKLDNSVGYTEYQSKVRDVKVLENIEATHNGIAKMLYDAFKTDFVCASISGNTWYQFINNKWEEIEDGVFLRRQISDSVIPAFVAIGKTVFEKKSISIDKSDVAHSESRMKLINRTITNLKSAPFKANVMKECKDVFYDKKFKDKLDKNPYLIAFKNGVYDLKLNKFRKGEPDDYLSKSMPINYTEFSQTDEKVKIVYEYLEKVFPDLSVRRYFMDQSSDIFVGGNFQKVVLFWLGSGDNSKSITQSIFEQMLGDLAVKFSTTLITGKKGNIGAAGPELARAGQGVRWAVLEEPDGDEQINVGIMKSLSGNDSYWARDLFEKGKQTKETKPLFKLIFIANKLPKMKYSDKATWNRIRVIPFESTFVKAGDSNPPPETFEEQLREKRFPMDVNFAQKIPDMLEPLAWVLLEHRKTITFRVEPEKVKAATELYRKQNDIYRQFYDENIVETNGFLTLSEIYAHFKEWFREGFPNTTIPIKNDVKEYYINLMGDLDRGSKWSGYGIRTLEYDIQNGNAIVLNDGDYDTDKKSPT